jgi:hypothetical protein
MSDIGVSTSTSLGLIEFDFLYDRVVEELEISFYDVIIRATNFWGLSLFTLYKDFPEGPSGFG